MCKKNSLFKKKNKGIAMVTIMITITFLAVVATTLLYISATNYAMKSANAVGKNNFYETDAKLVEVTSGIRNEAIKGGGDPAQNILTRLCMDYDGDGTVDDDYYDPTVLAGFISDPDFTLSSSYPKIEHPVHTDSAVTRYVFKDIEITHTSVGGSFENSVKTDLCIDVYTKVVNGGGGGGGVGNMSMLLDSPLSSSSATFKNMTMTGNAYIADYKDPGSPETWDDGHTYIGAGDDGLVMSNESRLNLCGDNNVVYGDLKLSGGSSLVLYGDLTVFGDISVSGNATLIVADGAHIYQYRDSDLPGKDHVSTFTAGAGNVYPSNLATNIQTVSAENFTKFAKAVNIYDTTGGDYGLISKIFVKGPEDKNGNKPLGTNARIIDVATQNGSVELDNVTGLSKSTRDLERGYAMTSPVYGFNSFGFGFIENQDAELTNLNATNYDNRLMISFNTKKITLLQSCPNTTWISVAPVTCDLQHCVTLSKIGTTQFNYMTAGKGDADSAAYNTDDNPFNNISLNLDKFTPSKKFVGKFGAFFEQDCNTTVDNMFGFASGGGGGTSTPVYYSTMYFDGYSRDYK